MFNIHSFFKQQTGMTEEGKRNILAEMIKLIILSCHFCSIYCQFWQKPFTPDIKIHLAHNLLIHKMKAEAERAMGTLRTLSNGI